ncbi:MAG: nicotinate (nicotinamide) nucleotide adenylyltransferase [Moraxella sp.]|nr:nicotinate (nicotinamide) nucleotide adenylyltransferase [Moraxella sp.]
MIFRLFFGGSFDPVHDGHLDMVRLAFHRLSGLGLSFYIHFLPTAGNPFKGVPTDPTHRLAMLSLACDLLKNQGIITSIDTTEIHQTPPIYTIDTVHTLAKRYPDDKLVFIMGEDSLADLHRWKSYHQLFDFIKIWSFVRAGSTTPYHDEILAKMTNDFSEFLDHKTIFYDSTTVPAISSTQIRQALAYGDNPPHLPKPIFDYIKTHGLYKSVL